MNRIWKRAINHLAENQSSLLRLGGLKEAMQFLQSKHIPLNSTSYSSIMQLCIDSKAEKEGRFLHDHLLRNGFSSDLYLSTKLIIFYAKIGDMDAACNVFDKMPKKSVVSWTAIISGFSQNGPSEKALEVFSEMHLSGLKANQFTYGSVLRSCTNMMCLEKGQQIHGCIVKSRFIENLFVQTALVDFYAKCGRIEDARLLFETMSQRDVVSWNAVIAGFAVQGLADDSFGMFRSMLCEGVMPDNFTFGSVLRACDRGKDLMKVNRIHGFIIQLGFRYHEVVIGSLIDAYARCGSVRNARFLYDSMAEKDLISCTALITGYARERCTTDALDLFNEINRMHMRMDKVILCSMFNICANIASLSLSRQFHAFALKNQPNYDTAMGNALIDMYAKSGEIEDANHALEEMQGKNVISWTSLIAGYGKHGYGEKAITLFQKMEGSELKPNDVTFLALLFACSHSGLISEGYQFFDFMVNKYNINPRGEHYACLVDLFARGGKLEKAYDLVLKMNVTPNASLWGSILGACRVYDNMSLGEVAARHLFNLAPQDAVNYVVLSSIYAIAGSWKDAWKTWKLMKDKGIEKDPGCCIIQCTK
uniref:Pentatricopeptide repeat-containing protein At3g20730-like n=1 Tax=Nelumbo nucifera TaxID=4432 RepID=A0A823A345_NELNU|nr:TPA_asm: hypothetical protein HUJ06_018435 [Nelumbo nucifera]